MASKRTSIVLCLIRCAETSWDETGRLVGATDLPLADTGRAAITAELGRLGGLKVGSVHHPPDEAATETARLCAERLGAKAHDIDELADPHLGLLEGLTEQEFEERFPSRYRQWEDDPLGLAPPEGEPLAEAAERIFRALARLLKRSRGEATAVVLHELAVGIMRCWLADRPLAQMHALAARRPRIERYVLPLAMLGELEHAVEALQSGA